MQGDGPVAHSPAGLLERRDEAVPFFLRIKRTGEDDANVLSLSMLSNRRAGADFDSVADDLGDNALPLPIILMHRVPDHGNCASLPQHRSETAHERLMQSGIQAKIAGKIFGCVPYGHP